MNSSSKKILLAVILVFVLANAFFAAYYITMKKAPDGSGTVVPAVTNTVLPSGDTAEPGSAASVTNTAEPVTNAAGEVIAAPGTAVPTDPSGNVLPSGQTPDMADPDAAADETTLPDVTQQARPNGNLPTPKARPYVSGPTYIKGILVVNKSYPLPSSYNPGGLTDECESAFYEMQAAAEQEGLDLYISSGFRSYDLQASLYQRYCDRDGQEEADTYSARPGHSEHQTGLAIDLNTITSDFAYTDEGKWVAEHCWEYGFILRYPADKVAITGYMYEPWHIRYLGKSTAAAVYQSGLCLEEYLGIDSVYSY